VFIFKTTELKKTVSFIAAFLNLRAAPGINYTGPSSYRKKNLPRRGLTKVENHLFIGLIQNKGIVLGADFVYSNAPKISYSRETFSIHK
jgi:hypothetical protein